MIFVNIITLCSNADSSEKKKTLVIGKVENPWFIPKDLMKTVFVICRHNCKACMTKSFVEEWMLYFDKKMKKKVYEKVKKDKYKKKKKICLLLSNLCLRSNSVHLKCIKFLLFLLFVVKA